jgi:hypothetical protein
MFVTVTEFSKKTGDYPSLSATDIKVIALTYQLEKEKVGTDHLKKEPQINRLLTFTHHLPNEVKSTTGFYSPGKKVCVKLVCTSELKLYNYIIQLLVYISSFPYFPFVARAFCCVIRRLISTVMMQLCSVPIKFALYRHLYLPCYP